MPFKIERNDITKVHTEAIVNTANPLPCIGSGTDAAIYTAAGEALMLAERKKIGAIEPGAASYTPGFRLFVTNGIRYVIHTVGTHWRGGENGEIEVMRNCYRNSLRIAKELNCKSLSIPLLATGNNEFPKELALHIALDEISKFLLETEMDVVLVVYDKVSFNVSERIFDSVQSYIDEGYIGQKQDINNGRQLLNSRIGYPGQDRARSEDIADTISQNTPHITPSLSLSLEDYIAQKQEALNFLELLKFHIEKKGFDNPTVYKRSCIVDKKLFSKINNGHIPSKHTVMALGLSLELNLEEFKTFLAAANFALNPADKFDIVVEYCIQRQLFDVMKIDVILFQMDLPCFIKD